MRRVVARGILTMLACGWIGVSVFTVHAWASAGWPSQGPVWPLGAAMFVLLAWGFPLAVLFIWGVVKVVAWALENA